MNVVDEPSNQSSISKATNDPRQHHSKKQQKVTGRKRPGRNKSLPKY